MSADRRRRICAERITAVFAVVTPLLVGLSLMGCSTPPKTRSDSFYKDRVRSLERELKRKQSMIQNLKERNLILEKRRPMAAAPIESSPSQAFKTAELQASASNQTQSASHSKWKPPAFSVKTQRLEADDVRVATGQAPEAKSVGQAQTGEHFLYSKVLESYRSRKSKELLKTIQILLKTYPDSAFADNALYLAGLLEFENGNYKKADQYMSEVLKRYPGSNKAVSALFAQGVIQRKIQKPKKAELILNQVKSRYPGSPEAARVALELKLLKAPSQKRQTSRRSK